MGRRIIKKDDGKYALFSSIVDDFLCDDCTEKELHDYMLELSIESFDESFKLNMKMIEKGLVGSKEENYEYFCEQRDAVHNREDENE